MSIIVPTQNMGTINLQFSDTSTSCGNHKLSFPISAWKRILDVLHPMIYNVPTTCRRIRYLKTTFIMLSSKIVPKFCPRYCDSVNLKNLLVNFLL